MVMAKTPFLRWFRVAIRKTSTETGVRILFEHPAVVGQSMEGWMDVGTSP